MNATEPWSPARPLRLTVVEINVYDDAYPLVCGYLQSYAQTDQRVLDGVEFDSYVASRFDSVDAIFEALCTRDADVFAFSCYVWNIGVVTALLPRLTQRFPHARFVLGGPQVMNNADRYISADFPAEVFTCNGEGELVFADLLVELISPTPDYASVLGITFRSDDGAFITTPERGRIEDLDIIPSPFLNKLFPGSYRMSVIETNRGCPYSCGFCFWGAANNSRIVRFSDDRIRAEISQISDQGISILHMADANWGILKRDIDLSRHMVDCKNENGRPLALIFSAAKNKPERVAEITKHFAQNGLISTQAISLQSLDPDTLEAIDRKNIKLANFAEVQSDLNTNGIGSYIEMIWPLPGETLTSFKSGIAELCDRDASMILVYPHMLLHNTPIHRDRELHGIQTVLGDDPGSESEMVIETSTATTADVQQGLFFYFATIALNNCRSLQATSRYLRQTGASDHQEIIDSFSSYYQSLVGDPVSDFCQDAVDRNLMFDINIYPTYYFHVLFQHREHFSSTLKDWAQAQSWWADENAQALFELDLLTKPLLYAETPLEVDPSLLKHLKLVDVSTVDSTYRVTVPARFAELVRLYIGGSHQIPEVPGDLELFIDHRKEQYPYNASWSVEKASQYRTGLLTRMASIEPAVEGTPAVESGLVIRARRLVSLGRARKRD